MRQLKHFIEGPRTCSYLPDRPSTIEYRLLLDVFPDELEEMVIRGWRRFGPMYFRPGCAACAECVPIRIPVERFTPTPSQLRARRRCRRFRLTLGPPTVDDERVALHRDWHAMRQGARGWEDSELDVESYFYQLAFPHPSAREVALYDGDRLVAVSICDVTPNAWSAVYFFYHPEIARLSPGVANVMGCVDLAREHGISHVYLGFRVQDCPSMRYKAGYHPHELLVGRPAMDEAPQWIPGERLSAPAPAPEGDEP